MSGPDSQKWDVCVAPGCLQKPQTKLQVKCGGCAQPLARLCAVHTRRCHVSGCTNLYCFRCGRKSLFQCDTAYPQVCDPAWYACALHHSAESTASCGECIAQKAQDLKLDAESDAVDDACHTLAIAAKEAADALNYAVEEHCTEERRVTLLERADALMEAAQEAKNFLESNN